MKVATENALRGIIIWST